MSDYTKTYDGAAKDAAEDPVAGSDFDTEFSAIATAIATKADITYVDASYRHFGGALATLSADYTFVSDGNYTVAWDAEAYDTDAIHDNATNNTRLTVPADVTYARVKASIRMTSSLTSSAHTIQILKNGSIAFTGYIERQDSFSTALGVTDKTYHLDTGVIPVTAGDYFEVRVYGFSTASQVIQGGANEATWFSMEIIQ